MVSHVPEILVNHTAERAGKFCWLKIICYMTDSGHNRRPKCEQQQGRGGCVPLYLHAQSVPKTLELSGTETAFKDKKNAWTVGVAGGLLSGTYMTFADELAQVLDDGDNLRILPIVTYGAASNLDDLLYLRGVDVAITQSDVFEYFRTQRKTPNLEH